MKYEGPKSYQSKDIANVKCFANKQTVTRTGQKQYVPDLSMWGHTKEKLFKYCGKRRKCWLQVFFPFTTMFSTFPKTYFNL